MTTSIAIIGAGAGLGAATAHIFGAEGFSIGLISRNQERASTPSPPSSARTA